MTTRDLIAVLLRRWYLMLVGAAISVGVLYAVTHQPGVYWTGFNVVVLAPTEEYYPNKLEDPHYDMPPIAGVTVRQWNGADDPLLTASSDTTLYGEGQRHGVQVRMVAAGTQWKPLFPVPVIDVQVVDTSPEVVAARAATTRIELNRLLQQRQAEAGVKSTATIVPLLSPPQPAITYHAGSRVRAALATTALGAASTTIAVYWVDRLLLWRRSRRQHGPHPARRSG